jgi:phosphate transport system permease protein
MMTMRQWIKSGAPYIWLNAGAVSICLVMVIGLILLIASHALGHFWPARVVEFQYLDKSGATQRVSGEVVDEESALAADQSGVAGGQVPVHIRRYLIKTGNREHLGLDFRWVDEPRMSGLFYPAELMVVERREWGNLYGYLTGFRNNGKPLPASGDPWQQFQELIATSAQTFAEIRHIEKDRIGGINFGMERLRIRQRGLELRGNNDPESKRRIEEEHLALQKEYNTLTDQLGALYRELNQYSITTRLSDGTEAELALAKVVRAYQPNRMSLYAKSVLYLEKFWEFVSAEPREANTEGGIFPAIFGTVMMVIIMAILVTPIGVVAAVYLHEYARQGLLTRIIRIAVNNLAGVPSIVYGVFGLGFFVYFMGGAIDRLFFPEALPAPTFGTPGLLWASLTLSLMTVPVVIVSTEEGLSRVPRAIREGSLALGATKAETLWRTVLPMTASAMMTGLILAVARAAGEVAPLMLVGVVKLAPTLPVDGNFPFFHLERKFMHLGFHIYDVGFQSPNVEAARPLVYATAFLLVLIIIALNLTAIRIRNQLREKYRAAEQH